MKPRLFIGSSVENLEIANALQQNLEYDANVTVWNQGVFNLSKSTLDDLLEMLETSDFGIFVFNPEDITRIRNRTFSTVRDNIVFELGLFIGKLGKEKVFYVVPRNVEELQLPTDLIGLNPGTYDNNRVDKNLQASLGPFSNQVRSRLKEFLFENLADLQGESKEAKKIAIEKKEGWEYFLACQLLDDKLKPINQSYLELEKGLVIQRKKVISGQKFHNFFESLLATHQHILETINNTIEELNQAFGPPGISGKSIEIKNAVDRIIQLCREQLALEFELDRLVPPKKLHNAKRKMQGSSKVYINQINEIAPHMRETINKAIRREIDGDHTLLLTLDQMTDLEDVVEEFRMYYS